MDRYEQAVVEMLQQKQAGLPATVKTFPPPRAVPDLMEAFRKSLASVQAEPRTMTASRQRRRSRKSRRLRSRASGKCCCQSRAGKPRPKRSLRRRRGGRRADDPGGSCAPARARWAQIGSCLARMAFGPSFPRKRRQVSERDHRPHISFVQRTQVTIRCRRSATPRSSKRSRMMSNVSRRSTHGEAALRSRDLNSILRVRL